MENLNVILIFLVGFSCSYFVGRWTMRREYDRMLETVAKFAAKHRKEIPDEDKS